MACALAGMPVRPHLHVHARTHTPLPARGAEPGPSPLTHAHPARHSDLRGGRAAWDSFRATTAARSTRRFACEAGPLAGKAGTLAAWHPRACARRCSACAAMPRPAVHLQRVPPRLGKRQEAAAHGGMQRNGQHEPGGEQERDSNLRARSQARSRQHVAAEVRGLGAQTSPAMAGTRTAMGNAGVRGARWGVGACPRLRACCTTCFW